MAEKTTLQKVLDLAGTFVAKHKGQWDHDQWEGFLEEAAALGVEPSDENKRSLGNLLESSKAFFCEGECICLSAPKKRAAAKPKAKPKAK